ncbi:RNA-directed DNA polymerase from mobile element jockey [Trichonephila clavipes]|nr:RNA-directed DNA polymerase from mobile element jockey [Trichonephila clavipes]
MQALNGTNIFRQSFWRCGLYLTKAQVQYTVRVGVWEKFANPRENGECASAALRSYHHTKGIRRGKGPLTNAAVTRRISKFEATGCLDDRTRSGRPSTRRNTAETVKDEMETVAGSSMHGEVSARAVARCTGIPYTTV